MKTRLALCGHEVPSHPGRPRRACSDCDPDWRPKLLKPRLRRLATCAHCRVSFEVCRTGPLPLCCSIRCRNRRHYERAIEDGRVAARAAAEKLARSIARDGARCRICDGPILGATNKRAYCSKRCAGGADRARAALKADCGESDCARGVLARGLCSTHYNKRYQPDRHKRPATCERCGCDYGAGRPNQRFCSVLCSNGGRVSKMTEAQRRGGRNARRRRRAILRAIPVEKFDEREIYERDRWVCQICRKRVGKTVLWPDPMSPSLDHIIPLSRPGTSHTRANVRLSHLTCNVTRGNRGGNEQLLLFGE